MSNSKIASMKDRARSTAVSDLKLLDTLPEERFDRIVRLAMALMEMPYAFVNLVDKERIWAKSTHDNVPYESTRDQSICNFAIRNTLPTVIEDTLLDENVHHLNYVVNSPKFRCYVGVPLTYNGEVVGALCTLDTKPDKVSAQKIQLLSDLAKIVENEFLNVQLEQESHGLRAQKKAWRDLSNKLQSRDQLSGLRSHALELVANGTPLKSTFHEMIEGVEREFPDMICSILLLDEIGEKVTRCYGPSLPDVYNKALIGLEIGHGVGSCGTAAALAERVIVSDIFSHAYWANFLPLAEQAQVKACWSEPILASDGQVLGTFAIYHREIRKPQEIEFRLIEQSAHLASIAIERDRANKLIWQQANYDALTCLPNRELSAVHINVAISNAQRNQQSFALMFLDLDRFKEVNDTLGHDAGDLLLIEASKRIQSCVRASDSVARLGGDEFVVLLNNVEGQQGVEKIASHILQVLTKGFKLKSDIAHISASIGVTFFPQDGLTLDVLMKNADQAMYQAKESGRDRFSYFTQEMREEANERHILSEDLRRAIKNDELVLYYQPIVDLTTGKIIVAEALVRWLHPTRGMLYPEDFIALSDDRGLIFPLTQWVINQASKQSLEWVQLHNHSFKVSVNTSLRQYTDNGRHSEQWLVDLEKNETNVQHLIFEVSEQLLVEPSPLVISKIARLKKLGIELAIDDFGTGYSSLIHIKKLGVDYLKIDKQFIANITASDDGKVLYEAIIAMTNKLGTKVVSEGIEQPQQLKILQEFGCELGQGYYLAYPLTAKALTERLAQQ
ncbi:EAL domain-containing protein [Psychrobium sp. nBUS_13]|uniref:sensor domain-containing phosphodiesterase n=1 Tax=Psychrobium sp. nBUS_13 TaxID=3395319 RepID=UPI003EBE4575